jgi:type II secretory pathway pseudopilin PulG
MVALLVALGVMAVMMTVAMPVWRQTAQREKEEELVFRGRQYARAIGLFEKKYANTPPPSMDVLIQERFLRKKYKDPITNLDFVPIPAGQAAPLGAGVAQGAAAGATPAPPTTAAATTALGAGVRAGGFIGVTSASKERSLRIFNGATHYNEWRFVYAPPAVAPGAAAPGGAGPRGAQPGQGGIPGGPGAGGRGGPQPGGPNRGNPNGGRNGGPFDPQTPGGRGGGPQAPAQPGTAPGPFGRGR